MKLFKCYTEKDKNKNWTDLSLLGQEPTFKSSFWLEFRKTKSKLLNLFSLENMDVQWNFNGSNTDGSFTTTVTNSFLSPQEIIPWLQIWEI